MNDKEIQEAALLIQDMGGELNDREKTIMAQARNIRKIQEQPTETKYRTQYEILKPTLEL